ncbi:MAG: histidine phosphatase family protein [Alphaproteobacteria bacterium]|nr:histidine phosphatase family protein [Alphaproteobacteria bacterium]
MKKIYLFRHGKTQMNLKGRWQGSGNDEPLAEEGKVQSEELANRISKLGLKIIYTSPLKRAKETANIVAKACNIPLVENKNLIEGCFGDAEGLTLAQVYEKFPDITPHWQSLEEDGMDVCFPPNGETKRQMQTRMIATIKEILANDTNDVIGICIHSALIRCTLLYFGEKLLSIPHDKIFMLEAEDSNLRFVEAK